MIRFRDRVYFVKREEGRSFLFMTVAVSVLCWVGHRVWQRAVDDGAVAMALLVCFYTLVPLIYYLLNLYLNFPITSAELACPENHYGERWYWFKCWIERIRRK